MTSPEVRAFIERTTRAQGLPYHVEDPATLQRIARLLLQVDESTLRPTPGDAAGTPPGVPAAAPKRRAS